VVVVDEMIKEDKREEWEGECKIRGILAGFDYRISTMGLQRKRNG
jgi:hypothetical protein